MNDALQFRWYRPKLIWVLFLILAVDGFLLVSEQLRWFGLQWEKDGAAVVITAVIVPILLVVIWIVARLAVRQRLGNDIPSTVRPRWYRLTPDRLVIGLLIVECLLWLSERFQWFTFNERFEWYAFNQHKGWTVLIAVGVVGVALLLMLLCFVIAVLFRLRFQFSIRSLLVLTVAVALPFSWLAVAMREPKQEREAAKAIEKVGGRISWGQRYSQFLPAGPNGELQMQEPEWLRNLLGDDFFCGVFEVNFENIPVTDADLAHLEGMSQLDELSLNNTEVTDVGLKHLQGLCHLTALGLDNTRITDTGLQRLRGLRELRTLGLAGTHVTDVGLEHLKRLKLLRWLDLRGTQVTDEGVEKLRPALPNIQGIGYRPRTE
jgi:hypothetical protein